MSNNNRFKVSDLDFNQIRENLKNYMRGQSQFSDYDFDGSALSVLIDLLAYNTHYNALYTNLAVNEMFLDSASKRSSVVSIANNFGYTPISARAARANVSVSVNVPGATEQLKYIPKFTSFSGTVNSVSYNFWTIQDYSAELNGENYLFSDVEIVEGTPQIFSFLCTEEEQKFILPNKDVDLSTLTLTVQSTSENAFYEKYERAENIIDITSTSKVYYVRQLEDETYEISFGTTGLGVPIKVGNVVSVTYLVTSKADANGVTTFGYTGESLGGTTAVTTLTTSYGGKDQETKEEIKKNVHDAFFDQDRAVTAADYSSIIRRYYSNIDSIVVWGGEVNDPPQYGKVFIAIKPANGPYLTSGEKTFIKESILKNKNVVSVIPEIVDPTYLEMEVTSTVYYDKNKTTRSIDELKTAVTTTIENYRDTNLSKFDGIFRMSKFSSAIDATDQSILSNITTFKLYSEVIPKFNVSADYSLNIVNPIYNEAVPEEAFTTTGFYLDNTSTVYYMDDDGLGNIRVYSVIEGTGSKVVKFPKIGTIDYNAGLIKINGLKIVNVQEANFYFIIKTQSFDVVSARNKIVDIPSSRITVNIIQDTTASGTYLGGTNYKFTSSRN